MRNKPITVTLSTNVYDNGPKTNLHSRSKGGTYSVGNDRISFLTKKRKRLVLNLNIQRIGSIATFSQSVI